MKEIHTITIICEGEDKDHIVNHVKKATYNGIINPHHIHILTEHEEEEEE